MAAFTALLILAQLVQRPGRVQDLALQSPALLRELRPLLRLCSLIAVAFIVVAGLLWLTL